MADMLQTGLAWLGGQMTAHCASAVVYTQGEDIVEVEAVIGKTEYETLDQYGFPVAATAVDFLIDSGDLGLTPAAGDQIAFGGVTYEAMALPGKAVYERSDGNLLRIHTKAIS